MILEKIDLNDTQITTQTGKETRLDILKERRG